MRRGTFLVVLVAFIFSCGGQWPILQGIAWVNMVREYSQLVPVKEAVQMTLSGQYPCALCKLIAEKKQSENEKIASLFQHEKKILSPGLLIKRPPAQVTPQMFVRADFFLQSWADVPPTPPPRRA